MSNIQTISFSKWLFLSVIALMVSSFFLCDVSIISSLLSIAVLFLIGFSLYYINNSYFFVSTNSFIFVCLYFLLIFSNPSVLQFSRYHIAALLLVWSLFFVIKYIVDKKLNYGAVLLSTLMIATVSIILPPAIWIALGVFVFSIFKKRSGVFKYFLTFTGAYIIVLFYLFSYYYFFGKLDIVGFFNGYFDAIKGAGFNIMKMDIIHIFFYFVVLLLAIRSFFFFDKGRSMLKVIHRMVISLSFFMTFLSVILFLLYYSDEKTPAELILFIPFSLIFLNFISNIENKKESRACVLLLIIVSLVYRVSFFL